VEKLTPTGQKKKRLLDSNSEPELLGMDDVNNMKMEEIKSEEDEPKNINPQAPKRQIPPLQ
jgi:hypothetical protein